MRRRKERPCARRGGPNVGGHCGARRAQLADRHETEGRRRTHSRISDWRLLDEPLLGRKGREAADAGDGQLHEEHGARRRQPVRRGTARAVADACGWDVDSLRCARSRLTSTVKSPEDGDPQSRTTPIGTARMMATQEDKAASFRALHDGPGVFVIPNPWDVGSSKMLAGLGFHALATSSAASACAMGYRDGGLTRDQALDHEADCGRHRVAGLGGSRKRIW